MGNATGYKERTTAKYFVAIGARDSYYEKSTIRLHLREAVSSMIFSTQLSLGMGSLLYQTWSFHVCIKYIFMCK